ncbi:MAG: NTP transferase domain-containing protein [Acidimicrobiales bacterium]
MTAFAGVVLCGGESRRMGRDKAQILVKGVAMARRVSDALNAAGASEVWAVGGDAHALGRLGLGVVPDDRPGGGPLPATLTALSHAEADVVVVLACDLLHPSSHAVRTVVDALEAAGPDVLAAVPVVDGTLQWTHAAWRRSARSSLEAAYDGGARSLKRGAIGLDLIQVHGLDPAAVADADTPDDLASSPMDIPEIDVVELAVQRQAGAALIDVREDDEYQDAHVAGARHIPLGEVADRVGEVPTEGTVYVICARGGRSAKAVEHYRSQGIDAVNVAGGTLGWIDAGQPVDRQAGSGADPA